MRFKLLVYGKVVNDEGAISLEVSRLEWLGKANTARGVKELTTPACEMVGWIILFINKIFYNKYYNALGNNNVITITIILPLPLFIFCD